jgi:hypothetical protein
MSENAVVSSTGLRGSLLDFRPRKKLAQSQRLSAGKIEKMLDSVTDPPVVTAAVEALNPKIEITLVE